MVQPSTHQGVKQKPRPLQDRGFKSRVMQTGLSAHQRITAFRIEAVTTTLG